MGWGIEKLETLVWFTVQKKRLTEELRPNHGNLPAFTPHLLITKALL